MKENLKLLTFLAMSNNHMHIENPPKKAAND